MKLTKKDALDLQKLFLKREFEGKKLSEKKIFALLLKNGSIEIQRVKAQREKVTIISEENIFMALKNAGYDVVSPEELLNFFDTDLRRDEIQKITNNTKIKTSASLEGYFLASLQELPIKLDGKDITLLPNDGLGYFIFKTQTLSIENDIIIVGIENYQVLWFSKMYAKFYDSKKYLFIFINSEMLKWMESQKNEYIHFGDFDLAGINIYINKVVPRLKKCKKYSMLIPESIAQMVEKYGDYKLYQQQTQYENLRLEDASLIELRDILKRAKKSLEQEGIIHFKY